MGTDYVGRAALAMDDILVGPDGPEIVAALRAAAPGWLVDQVDAAEAQVRSGSLRAAAEMGMSAGVDLPADQHPGWLRLDLCDALVRWVAGQGSTCVHAPAAVRPEPVAAAAWRPGLVVCERCTHLLALPRHSVADRRCDGCGRITTGPENGDGIWPTVVVVGVLTYLFGVCVDCKYWDDESGAAS